MSSSGPEAGSTVNTRLRSCGRERGNVRKREKTSGNGGWGCCYLEAPERVRVLRLLVAGGGDDEQPEAGDDELGDVDAHPVLVG
eukprot:2228199-Rhodomonas_salina.1